MAAASVLPLAVACFRDRYPAVELEIAMADPVESIPRLRAGELDMAMVLALGSLSATDQELLLLVAWERLSNEQLAEMLGLSRGTVAVRLHRARRRLRRALAIEEQRTSGAPGRAPKMEVFDG